MNLRQDRFECDASGPFKKLERRLKKYKKNSDSSELYWNAWHKACFQHGLTYKQKRNIQKNYADNAFKYRALISNFQLENKRYDTVIKLYENVLKSDFKRDELWDEKDSEFYNKVMNRICSIAKSEKQVISEIQE